LQCVAVCCSVLQCVAVCCSVLQCVAVCCSVLQCVAVWCSVLQCVAVCCSVLQCVAVCCSVCHLVIGREDELLEAEGVKQHKRAALSRPRHVPIVVLQCVAACCSVLQCVVVCCSVLQCVAVCCSGLRRPLTSTSRTSVDGDGVLTCSVLQLCCSVLQLCCSVAVDQSDHPHRVLQCVARVAGCTATHCNTLQHAAACCHTPQHTATHCNTLQHAATYRSCWPLSSILYHLATNCDTCGAGGVTDFTGGGGHSVIPRKRLMRDR